MIQLNKEDVKVLKAACDAFTQKPERKGWRWGVDLTDIAAVYDWSKMVNAGLLEVVEQQYRVTPAGIIEYRKRLEREIAALEKGYPPSREDRLAKDARGYATVLNWLFNPDKRGEDDMYHIKAIDLIRACCDAEVEMFTFLSDAPFWWEVSPEEILQRWQNGVLSEGSAAYLLGVSRAVAREMLALYPERTE